jgi:peptide/nickel transport system substrate-binding protein
MLKRLIALAFVVVGLSPLAFGQGDPDVLTVALSSAPETLDQHVASSRAVPLLENVYEPLAGLQGPTLEISPVLAESWDVSEDGTVFTFHLRPGVTFHDGTPLTADAVKLNFDRVKQIQKGPYWALEYLRSVEVVDAATVRMTIEPGGPPFIQAVSMVGIISPKAIQDHMDEGEFAQDYLAANTDGTGPYAVAQYVRGDRIVLQKFDDYWQGWDGAHFSRAVMLFVPEMSSAQLMLEKGEVDIAEQVPPESLGALRSDPNITVYESDDGVRVLYLMMNFQAGPTADKRVRLALNYAFDKDAFLTATGGAFVGTDGPVPSSLMGGFKPELPYDRFDLQEAKRLFEEAGQQGATIDLYYTTGDQTEELAGQILQANLAQIGVKANVIAEDFPALLRALTAWSSSERSADDPNFHMSNFLYTPPRMPDAYAYLWYMYHSAAQGGRGRNLNFYANPQVDALIEQGALANNPDDRMAAYRQAIGIIVDDVPQVFVGTARKIYPVRADVGGFYMHPTWYPAVRVYPLHRN